MPEKPINPPAFPYIKKYPMRKLGIGKTSTGEEYDQWSEEYEELVCEVTLLDHFAGEALSGFLAACTPGFWARSNMLNVAEQSYNFGEAMLIERQKRMNKENG